MSLSLTTAESFTSNVTTTAASDPAYFQSNLILGLIVELVIAFLICGHFLILATLFLYKPWNIADLLIFSLSIADTVNAVIPLQMLNVLNNFIGPHLWTRASCVVFVIFTYTFRIASVCTITLISGDRAILLTKPLQHHIIVTIGRARKAVVAIWLFSIFMAVLPFIGVGHPSYDKGYCFYQLYDFGTLYGVIVISIGIVQLVLVLICFIAIKVTSVKFVRRQSLMAASKQTGGKQQEKRETAGTLQVKQMSFMMAIVVLLYYISWLPYLLTNLYSMVAGQINHITVILIGFFSLVNALINPLLYGKMCLRYRKGYCFVCRKILSLCGGEKPEDLIFDSTRPRASAGRLPKCSALQTDVRKRIDFSRHEGGPLRNDGTSNRPSATQMKVKCEGGYEQEKPHEDKEDKPNQNDCAFTLEKSDIAEKVILEESHLNISFTRDDEELKTTPDADATQLSDETLNSTL